MLNQKIKFYLAIVLLLTFTSMDSWAHKPVVIDGGPTDYETAHEVPDPVVSYVGYHERTSEAPELWFTFESEEGSPIFMQLGVPEIERYESLRPSMVLLGPGLPEIDVPFEIPEGYGGIEYKSEDQGEPVYFEEEFTGTNSWQFEAVEIDASATARYYLVGYIPSGEDGKFFMALGEKEVYGFSDLFTLPRVLIKVRRFHEVFPIGGLLGWVLLFIIMAILGLVSLMFSGA